MLELDIPTIIFEIANFLILSVLLYHFLFKPVMLKVQIRADEKARLLQEIDESNREAARLREEWETRLANIEEDIADIIARAQKKLEEERRNILQSVEIEAERILNGAQAESLQMRQRALAEFQDDLLNAVMETSARLIGQAVPQELHDTFVQQLNDRIWELGRSDEVRRVESIRRSLGRRTPTVVDVTSAQPLSPDQQKLLIRTLSALADRGVHLELKTDPALAAGLHIRLGDVIIENSISAQLAELREVVANALEERVSDG